MKTAANSSEAFSIIVVGSWNPAIFSPQWVKLNLATDQTKEVVMAYPMPFNPLPPRVSVEEVNIYPSPQMLAMECITYSDDALVECCTKIQKVCELLPHTPVTAVGINFRFSCTFEESAALTSVFSFPDAANIDAGKYAAVGSLVKRAFRLNDSGVLNLGLEMDNGQDVRVEMNFHSDVTNATQVSEKSS